jgi:hypothetical protein
MVAIILSLLAFSVLVIFYPVWGLDDRFERPLTLKLLKMPRKPNRTIRSFDSPVDRYFSSRPIEMRNFKISTLDLDIRRKKRRSKGNGK